jgi:hypothetical protein
VKAEKDMKKTLLQTEQFASSDPSPQPSRPEQTMASDLQRPFAHRNGQYPDLLLVRALQASRGSSLPSLHITIALQNSYSGKQRPSEHLNVRSGQPGKV